MKIALPISHIISDDNILYIPDIDVYQVRNVYGMEKLPIDDKPLIFHDSKGVVCWDFEEHFKEVQDDLSGFEFDLYSTNLMPASEDYSKVKGPSCEYYKCDTILDPDELLDIVEEKLKFIRPYAKTIAFENGNRYPQYNYNYLFDPVWLDSALNKLGVGFTFDIAHAVVSYRNYFHRDYDSLKDYIMAHPLDKAVEVHISGAGYSDSIWDNTCYDMHNEPRDLEWQIFGWLLPNLKEEVFVAIEYYGQMNIVISTYNKLFSILNTRK